MFRVGDKVRCTRGRYSTRKLTVQSVSENGLYRGGGYCLFKECRASIAWGALEKIRPLNFKLENK